MQPVEHGIVAEAKVTDILPEKTEVTRPTKAFGVAASPFNGIKLELGLCVIFGVLLWLAAEFITANGGAQLLMLLSYSLLSTTWLVIRTRAVLRRYVARHPIS